MASTEERFQAAVNVIKGLPKNGPYQPSTAMMLKFYGYYKQATDGPCNQKKPGFWDVVGKAKWDAWNDNRHLSKEQAMQRYVDNLREIIETMSFNENVQNFVGSINDLDSINLDELEMVAPGLRQIAESHPSSPFNSRTNSPHHSASVNTNGVSANTNGDSEHATMNGKVYMNGHAKHMNGDVTDGDSSATATPTLEQPIQTMAQQQPRAMSYAAMSTHSGMDQSDDEYADPLDIQNEISESMLRNNEMLQQIQATVLRMNSDLVTMNQRIGSLEQVVRNSNKAALTRSNANRFPRWWPFKNISPGWFVLLVLWPFIVKRAARMLANRRRD